MERLNRTGNPADQAAPADGHEDEIGVGAVLQDFEADRTLTGDDIRIIEGMDKDHSLLRKQLRLLDALADILPREHHIAAVAARRLLFGDGSRFRHDDGCLIARPSGRQGHSLGMIAGGSRHHPFRPDRTLQVVDLVGGPAQFEGARFLQVFQFQIHLGPGHVTEGGRIHQGRADDSAVKHFRSLPYGVKGDHGKPFELLKGGDETSDE